MLNLIKSLQLVLSGKDFKTLVTMSVMLTLVALIEVGGLVLIAFLVLNLENLSEVLLSFQFIEYFVTFSVFKEEDILIIFAGVIAIYSFITILISTMSIRKISIFSELMGAKIKTSLLKYFLNLEWMQFSQSQSSDKMSRIIHDGDIVADIINFAMNLFNKFVLAIIITCGLFLFNSVLTFWLALILCSAYLIIFAAFKSETRKNSLQITKYMDITVNIVTNIFGSFKEIIFYHKQKKVIDSFEKVDSNLANLKGINMSYAYMPRFYIDSALLLMLVAASIFVSANSLSASSFFATLSVYGIAGLKLLPAFQNIFYFSYEIFTRLPHLDNVTALLIKNSGNQSFQAIREIPSFNKGISFKNVSFSYDKEQINPLVNIDLSLLRGKKIAIIGPTGSGKSTFVDLFLGFLKPNSGIITMDDRKIDKENIYSYRKNISFVPQKIFFLEDTLKQNIVFGSSGTVDLDKLNQAISDSYLKDLIDNLPNGLETNISDTNQMVSGGQKQCVGIARALYRGGDILLLDEATSGMDQKLENLIYESVFKSQFQTFICVTHNLDLLDQFDEVIVFNNGRIEAIGSYKDLKNSSNFLSSVTGQIIN
ncbi:ABC transporter ATP-binding protein/permease [Gammaproteobacteria bacterium]|nr:ABC transporter ATP-binding protein/permease [Gammaproteobacteria bacterium]